MSGTTWTQRAATVAKAIVTWVRQESAATQALITAFLALGIAFQWWHWSNAETGAVIGIVTALLGMFVRSQVTPLIRPRTSERRLVPEGDPAAGGHPAAPARPAAAAPWPAAPPAPGNPGGASPPRFGHPPAGESGE
jgi:hypothetical protein